MIFIKINDILSPILFPKLDSERNNFIHFTYFAKTYFANKAKNDVLSTHPY